MRAVVVRRFGAPETFAMESFSAPPPGPGEVRIAIRSAGVSFVDVLTAAGKYQVQPPLPMVPGSEFAGIIDAVGDGVDGFAPGDRVAGAQMTGALAETITLSADRVMPIGPDVSFAKAAVFRPSFATAYHALIQRAQLVAGERVLVLGAAGAVGQAAIQLAALLGARVIASASTADKRAAALAAGAEIAIDSRSDDWRGELRAALQGRPLDIVCDPVGGEATEPAFRSLGWNGRHLVIGFAGGGIPRIGTNLALLKGIALIGVDIRQFEEREPALAAQNLATLHRWLAEGRIAPCIAERFAFDRFAEAMNMVARGDRAGRIVVDMAHD